jgi:hypothetical protein
MPDGVKPQQHAPKGRIKAHPMELASPMEKRCTATNRRGTRCEKPPIPGGTVCHMHGGNAPNVRAKAEERLQALVHPAITRLGELVGQVEFPSVAIAAVKDVLDRNLGKAAEQQMVEHSGTIEIAWKTKPRDSQKA